MRSRRLLLLQTVTAITMVIYMLMLVYMFNAIITSNPMANPGMAERAIQSAATIQELQSDFRDEVHNLSFFVHRKNELLLIFCCATIVMIGFLGWSTFMMSRIKREVDHDA